MTLSLRTWVSHSLFHAIFFYYILTLLEMKLSHILVLVVAFVAIFSLYDVQASVSPGIITSVNMGAVTNLAGVILPRIFEEVRNTHFDDMSASGANIKGIAIRDIGMDSFSIDTANDQLNIHINSFRVSVHARVKAKKHHIHVSADVDARVGGATAHIGIKIVNNGDRYQLQLSEANVNVSDFHVTLSHSFIAKILNAIKSLFNGMIKRMVTSAMKKALESQIRASASAMVDAIPTSAALGPLGVINLAAANVLRYDQNTLSLSFDGTVAGRQPVARNTIENIYAPRGKLFDMVLDTYTFNSAFSAVTYKGLHTGDNSQIPVPGWKTDNWSQIQPLMAKNHLGHMIQIQTNLLGAPVLTAANGVLSLTGAFDVVVLLADANLPLLQIRVHLNTGASIRMDNNNNVYTIVPQVANINVSFETIQSIVGDIDFALWNGILSFITNGIVVPAINQQIQYGVVIPTIPQVALSNPVFDILPGAIRVATDISINI